MEKWLIGEKKRKVNLKRLNKKINYQKDSNKIITSKRSSN